MKASCTASGKILGHVPQDQMHLYPTSSSSPGFTNLKVTGRGIDLAKLLRFVWTVERVVNRLRMMIPISVFKGHQLPDHAR